MVGGYGLKIKLFNYAVWLNIVLNANSRAIAIVVLVVLSAVECKFPPKHSIDKSSSVVLAEP